MSVLVVGTIVKVYEAYRCPWVLLQSGCKDTGVGTLQGHVLTHCWRCCCPCCCRYMRATAPAGMLPELQRDEGLCLYGLGRLAEAAEVLGEYLRQGAPSGDAAVVTAVLQKIRERTAEAAAAAAVAAAGGGASASVEEDGDAGAAGRTAT